MTAENIQTGSSYRADRFEVMAMGGSAGSLEPMMAILQSLPVRFPLPIIVVLHIPERYESYLAEIFRHRLRVQVSQAEDKAAIEPGRVYVAGSSYHLSVERGCRFSLSDEIPEQFSRPSIDVLFRSVGDVYGRSAIAFLFSGASEDGARGLASIKKNKGITVVQNPDDARFPMMPQAALKTHRPDRVLTAEEMQQFVWALGDTTDE